ncbi:hypothetical protein PYW07_006613 [Mythimna separata]|uniref:THAP-type domain-containing protein n=1 Tax=Mythimna separata TaxID=271217 RepID=A0AAD7YWL9_MYTSE|nr:hypothetical protein PYW07_006613 [Mythimna separata]
MPSCVMRYCSNYTSKTSKSQGITYHSFPTNELRCIRWVDIVRKQRNEEFWQPTKSSKICSIHFKVEDKYLSGKGYTLLKKSARGCGLTRKTTRCSYTTEDLQNAAKAVKDEGKSVNATAKEFSIKRMTFSRYLKKLNEGGDSSMSYATPRQVFSSTQEDSLKKYLLQMASIFYGYSPKDVRRLAYECANKFEIEIPPSWTANKMAGKEWLTMFLKRNLELSIRKPEPTSLGRATSFNAQNVKVFFEKLAEIMDRYEFTAADIWNIDEAGVSTVLKPNKIVAAKRKRNVGAMTSRERGTNVMVVTAVSALGNAVPAMFVFPRKQFKTHFLNGGPPECIGAGNASGWVTDEEFYQFMQHFIKHVKPSMERPVLLVLDNHCSHLNVKTLTLAKENGVVMLSFPPHCSHKLQPLDVSVFGPFKKYCAAA